MKFSRVGLLVFFISLFSIGGDLSVDNCRSAFAQSTRSERITGAEPAGGGATRTVGTVNQVGGENAQVTGLKLLTLKEQTRIMLDLSREAKFEVRRLKENPLKHTPARIYIDILGAKLALASGDTLAVDDGVLRQVRVGQYSADVVRVVIDMNALRAHHAFIIPEPTQLVIDILGQGAQQKSPAKEVVARVEPASQKPVAAAKKADSPATGGGLRKIVLDPGHGGKDPGAIGVGGIAEKDIVLSVAKKLARKLRTELGVQVVLTRNDDRFVALEDRTATANSEDADLFISLHVNASPNSESRGIETYYLDNTTDEAAIRLAARENRTSRRNISDLQFILSDMMQNMKLEDSITLAHRLQGALVGGMTKITGDVKDLGVKKALFHVLVGARMPSVLVEMFFITHRAEARAMSQDSHQDALVEALYEGIQKFGQTNLMAKTL
jgi:N-acetylmuramoyl-L-alanine amidase